MSYQLDSFESLYHEVPYRSPFHPLYLLKSYFENKNVFDLGCGGGDLCYFVKKYLNANSVRGIDRGSNHRHDVPIQIGDIRDVDFKNIKNIDTYISWIEDPDVEMFVINELLKNSIKTNYIISYCTDQVVCNKCNICDYLKCIPYKKKRLLSFLNDLAKDNFIDYESVTYPYDDGKLCRQSGTFTYYIISL